MPDSILTPDDGALEVHCPVCEQTGDIEFSGSVPRLSPGFAFSDTRVPHCVPCAHVAGVRIAL